MGLGLGAAGTSGLVHAAAAMVSYNLLIKASAASACCVASAAAMPLSPSSSSLSDPMILIVLGRVLAARSTALSDRLSLLLTSALHDGTS